MGPISRRFSALQIHSSTTLGHLARNAGWLFVERVVRFLMVFVSGVLMIRHLGPELAGTLSYSVALALFLGGFCDLGLDPIIKLEVIRNPTRRGLILGSAGFIRLALVPLAFLAFAQMAPHGNSSSANISLLIGIGATLAWPAVMTMDSWFQSQTQARRSVWAQTTGLTLGAILRLIGVGCGASLAWFGWIPGFEMIITAAVMFWLYKSSRPNRQPWKFDRTASCGLLTQSWSLALTNLAILAYTKLDVVLLSQLTDNHDVGIYTAATRFTEAGYILPMILVNTLFPLLTRLHAEDHTRYMDVLRKVLIVVAWGGLITAGTMTIASSWIIKTFYGAEFAQASGVLVISSWGAIFAGLGAIRAQWLLLNGFQHYGLYYVAAGAALSVLLNLSLIPSLGPTGAAWTGLSTQAFIVLVAPLFFRNTRPSVPLLLGAFVFAGLRNKHPRSPTWQS